MVKKKKPPVKEKPAPQRITGPRSLQQVSGMRDRIGKEVKWWGFYQQIAFEVMEKYNFFLMHPASIEYTTAYTRTLGKDHHLVNENLLTVLDESKEHLSLRPSFDVSYLRAYFQHHRQDFENGMPIDHWYTIGSVFGEQFDPREKFQMHMAVMGNPHPVVDAECTVAAYRYLQMLGFTQIQVLINSIGGKQSLQAYKQELSTFYKDHKKDLPADMQVHIAKDPFMILTSTNEQCKKVNAQAPQSVDWLVEEDKEHFIRVLEYLDELEVPYMLAPEMVPVGAEYRNKTLISLKVTTEEGTEYMLAQGGRADGLGADMIDMDVPMMNMTIDLDRCLTATRNSKLEIPQERVAQVFVAQLGDDAKKRALALREELHEAGIKTVEHFGQDSLKEQLEQAMKLGVAYTCILGQKEILDKTILVRDMDGGIQEEVPLNKLVVELKKRLT